MNKVKHNGISHALRVRRLGIDTYQEAVVYMRRDCHVCRSEGFETQARIRLEHGGHSIIATLNVITTDLLGDGEAGLSEAAWQKFQAICEAQGGVREFPQAQFTHPVTAPRAGRVVSIDNRLLARIAKLAGAPKGAISRTRSSHLN